MDGEHEHGCVKLPGEAEGRAQRCQDEGSCGGVTGTYLSTVNHSSHRLSFATLPLFPFPHHGLLQRSFPYAPIDNSGFRVRLPKGKRPVSLPPQYFLASFQPSHPCAPVFFLFPIPCFSPQHCSMFVATPCESVGFVGYRNTYAHTQRSRRAFPGCICHSRLELCSESRIP